MLRLKNDRKESSSHDIVEVYVFCCWKESLREVGVMVLNVVQHGTQHVEGKRDEVMHVPVYVAGVGLTICRSGA